MQDEARDIEPDDLDLETYRLLEDKIYHDTRLLASVCGPRIRRDYERSTYAAVAQGASSFAAVGNKIDPNQLEQRWKTPYLTKAEEEWLKTFRRGAEKAPLAVQARNVLIGIVAAVIAVWMVWLYIPDFGTSLARQFVTMAPMFLVPPFDVYFKQWIVRQLGPTGCAFLAPRATTALVFFYCSILLSIAASLVATPFAVKILMPIVPLLILLWYARAYFRKRRRILENYREVWEILELPGLENIPEYQSRV